MNRRQFHRRGWRSVSTAGGAALAVLLAMAPNAADAAQPYFVTPANTPLLANVLYKLAYAVSDRNGTPQTANAAKKVIAGGSVFRSETIVSIGLPFGTTGHGCQVQVQWVDHNGASAGVSGPVIVSGEQTREFTTVVNPTVILPPYVLNVFSNLKDTPFEGHANIRSDCSKDSRLRVDAGFQMAFPISAAMRPLPVIKSINVVRPTGNVGE